jgi:DNA-binding XRE family transcriptional regulator
MQLLALSCQGVFRQAWLGLRMPRPSQIDPRERKLVLLLKRERLRKGISANKLAAQVGLARTTITHLESDDACPTFWVLLKIADGLGVDFPSLVAEAFA